jgi:hypothetical protein
VPTNYQVVSKALKNTDSKVELLKKQLNEEREQRLRMEEAFSKRLQAIKQAKI